MSGTFSDKIHNWVENVAILCYLSGMRLTIENPYQSEEVESDVKETATLMTTMLRLQHYSPEKALRVLMVAAKQIVAKQEDIETLKLKATLRGINLKREFLAAEGGQLSAEQFGKKLDVSRETVNQWRKNGMVLAWKRGVRNYYYPAWQIYKGTLLPGLTGVREALGLKSTEVLEMMDYLLSRSEELGGYPLDFLRRGEIEPVIEHAGRYGRIGT